MSAFYNAGEVKTRPGVYRRIVNIGKITIKPSTHTPVVPDEPIVPDEPTEAGFTMADDGTLLYSGDAPTLDENGVLVFSTVPTVTDGILHF